MLEEIMYNLKLKNYVKANELVKQYYKICDDRFMKRVCLYLAICIEEQWTDKLEEITEKYYKEK